MIELKPQTLALLDEIESRIDPEIEDDFRRQWSDFLHHRFTGDIFSPKRRQKSASSLPRRDVRINETLDDLEAMLYAQLLNVSDALESDNKNLSVRANYGTGILSSVLGAELFILPDACNTLPTTRPPCGARCDRTPVGARHAFADRWSWQPCIFRGRAFPGSIRTLP